MRFLLILGISLLSVPVFANSKVLAQYELGLETKEKMATTFKVKKISVTEEQRVTVSAETSDGILLSSKSKKLDDKIFEELLKKIEIIKDSKVIFYSTNTVCKIIVPPFKRRDHLQVRRTLKQDEFQVEGPITVSPEVLENPELVTVLSPRGCWASSKVFLEDDDANAAAEELKDLLKKL